MRTVLLLFVFYATACAADRTPDGGKCAEAHECESGLTCYQGACSARQPKGAKCNPKFTDYRRHCDYELSCSPKGVCEDVETRNTRLAAESVKHEREMLRQSGIEAANERAAAVEDPLPASAPGLKVRVVRTTGSGRALAACQNDERLVSGGCSPTNVSVNRPSHHSETDTVGARWNCGWGTEVSARVEAFALCQAVQ